MRYESGAKTMAEYIEREALQTALQRKKAGVCERRFTEGWNDCLMRVKSMVHSAKAADVAPVAGMKEFAAEVAYQFGYKGTYNGRLHIMHGGLSTLERAFEILGWENPHPYPEGECDWDGCHEYATCGTPTPDGYKRVCSKHFAVIEARKEAERARMDGE